MNSVVAAQVDALAETPPSVPAAIGPSETLSAILKLASDPAMDVGKIAALVDLHRRLQADQAAQQFNDAFAQLSAALPRITKKGEVKYPVDKNQPNGPQKKAFSYARWEDIDEIVRPLLIEHHFHLAFNTEPMADGRIIVKGMLAHVGGHSREVQIGPLPLDTSGGKNNIQALGSTTAYGKRYCGTMLLNLIFEGEDDDGVRGGTILIDAASVKTLSDMIMATSSDEKPISLDGFLRFMQVETLADIQIEDYPKAQNMLLSRMSPAAVEKFRATLPKPKEKK